MEKAFLNLMAMSGFVLWGFVLTAWTMVLLGHHFTGCQFV